MMPRPTRVPSFITDEDERLLGLLQADPQARQLLACFAALSAQDRHDVSRLARACQDAHPTMVAVHPHHPRALRPAR